MSTEIIDNGGLYLRIDCYGVGNRPAEAVAEISAHLPSMPRGGNLVT